MAQKNDTIGEIRTSYRAARNANIALTLAEAMQACEEEGFLEDHQAKLNAASKKLDAARDKAYQASRALGEKLRDFNGALSSAELTNDIADLVGAGASVAGIIFTGGLAGVALAGTGLAADGFTALGRPGDPDVVAQIGTGGQLTSGVIGVGDAVASLPVPTGPHGLLRPGPGLISPSLGVADGVVGAGNNVLSAFNTEARRLVLSSQNADGFRALKQQLGKTDLTFVESYFGEEDKVALDKALDDAIAAEEEYQAAFEEWKKALNQDWIAQESTCIENKERAIDAADPVPLHELEHQGEMALRELNEAERLGKRTFNAEQNLKLVRTRLLNRARRLAGLEGG